MSTKKLPSDFEWLSDMYEDDYFPDHLVDKIKASIQEVASFLESGTHSTEAIQQKLDAMTIRINELQEEFEAADSELETVARESIGETVMNLLEFFDVDIDIEEAIRERDW
jgi:hypothetical protein